MNIPNLDNLIAALECDNWTPHHCQHCPYEYQYLDDHGDNIYWCCDEDRKIEDALFYLKLYQYLIKEKENGSM